MVRYFTRKDKARVVADAVGISHFVVANVIMIGAQANRDLGLAVRKFMKQNSDYPGIDFVYKFMDAPIYQQFRGTAEAFREGRPRNFWLTAECIVLLSSMFYGLLAYVVIRLCFRIFGK